MAACPAQDLLQSWSPRSLGVAWQAVGTQKDAGSVVAREVAQAQRLNICAQQVASQPDVYCRQLFYDCGPKRGRERGRFLFVLVAECGAVVGDVL